MIEKKKLITSNVLEDNSSLSDSFIESNFQQVRNRDLMLSSKEAFSEFSEFKLERTKLRKNE